MTPLRKYQLLLAGTVVLFFWLLSTEVAERYIELWKTYTELEMKEGTASEPEALAAERSQLLVRQKWMKDLLRAQTGAFEQSRTGTLEFINVSATQATVRLESLVPMKVETRAHEQIMGFRLTCSGPVHRIGVFINQLEEGPFSLHLSKLDLSREGVPAPSVKGTIEGSVRLAM
jgi:hypothetical protein